VNFNLKAILLCLFIIPAIIKPSPMRSTLAIEQQKARTKILYKSLRGHIPPVLIPLIANYYGHIDSYSYRGSASVQALGSSLLRHTTILFATPLYSTTLFNKPNCFIVQLRFASTSRPAYAIYNYDITKDLIEYLKEPSMACLKETAVTLLPVSSQSSSVNLYSVNLYHEILLTDGRYLCLTAWPRSYAFYYWTQLTPTSALSLRQHNVAEHFTAGRSPKKEAKSEASSSSSSST
jgi:hypothetical protein